VARHDDQHVARAGECCRPDQARPATNRETVRCEIALIARLAAMSATLAVAAPQAHRPAAARELMASAVPHEPRRARRRVRHASAHAVTLGHRFRPGCVRRSSVGRACACWRHRGLRSSPAAAGLRESRPGSRAADGAARVGEQDPGRRADGALSSASGRLRMTNRPPADLHRKMVTSPAFRQVTGALSRARPAPGRSSRLQIELPSAGSSCRRRRGPLGDSVRAVLQIHVLQRQDCAPVGRHLGRRRRAGCFRSTLQGSFISAWDQGDLEPTKISCSSLRDW